jgi:phenylalanyl-tRNA synthetase beta subunit
LFVDSHVFVVSHRIYMKVLYSELKTFIPTLKVAPKAVADALALTGLLVDAFEQVTIAGKKDYVISLEVRAASRPDCLGVIGVAREVAVYFNLPFVLPKLKLTPAKRSLSVQVKAVSDIYRVCVIEVDGLNNTKASPPWLSETVQAHGMNSVSLLVDISNYAMLMTGYPNHIFDAGKVVGGLVWHRVPKETTLTTLDGTTLELHKGKELVISDNLGPLVLASAVGGRRSAISERTTSVLAEVAVYDPVKMRQDARSLGVVTEASNRLEKDLSPEFALWALEYVADCLVRLGGGRVVSTIFDYYPKQSRVKPAKIFTPLSLVEDIAGIPISQTEGERILKRLGFSVSRTSDGFQAAPPTWRLDVVEAPDVAEEIIRIKGFNTIPSILPALRPVADVTSARITFAERLRDQFAAGGFDEVLSLPTTTPEANSASRWEESEDIRTQNAINEEFPVLRIGLAGGLISQQHEYLRKGVYHNQLFEIGRVFCKRGKRYVEREHVGVLLQTEGSMPSVATLQAAIERVLRSVGCVRLSYEPLGRKPDHANPHAAWLILVGGKTVGLLYQLKDLPLSGNKIVERTAYAELDIESLLEQLATERPRGAQELTQKLVALDTNIEVGGKVELDELLFQAVRSIGRAQVWALDVVDAYKLPSGQTRYTVRVSYQGLQDAAAKALHEKVFGRLPEVDAAVAEEATTE